MIPESTYILGDDESHPIPFLASLDVFGLREGGGADLVIVIASPLKADERALRRLMQKIENYLGFINSDEYLRQAGVPSRANTRIAVRLHPGSDPAVSTFLTRCTDWVAENNATLAVERI